MNHKDGTLDLGACLAEVARHEERPAAGTRKRRKARRNVRVAAIWTLVLGTVIGLNAGPNPPLTYEMTSPQAWNCLLDLGLTGNPNDHREALYPTREERRICRV